METSWNCVFEFLWEPCFRTFTTVFLFNLFPVQREETRSARLDVLVSEAERRVVDLTAAVLNGSSGSNTVSTNQQKVSSWFPT